MEAGGGEFLAAGTGIPTLEGKRIVAHGNSGLTGMREAYAAARHNSINRNAQFAVCVDVGAGGVFEENDLTDNLRDAWDIDRINFGQVMRLNKRG